MYFKILTSPFRRKSSSIAAIAVTMTVSVLASGEDTTIEEAVLRANIDFYRAFADRGVEKMDSLWATDTPVAVIHPGWIGLEGRDAQLEGNTG